MNCRTRVTVHAWVDDEGAYAIQVKQLQDGHWDYPYAGSAFDPDGKWFPLIRAEHRGDQFYPYIKHPVYVLAMFGTVQAFGSGVGFYILPIAGLILAAIAAWLLASYFDRRAARPAFWLVAVSPLMVNAFILWAHTLSPDHS